MNPLFLKRIICHHANSQNPTSYYFIAKRNRLQHFTFSTIHNYIQDV